MRVFFWLFLFWSSISLSVPFNAVIDNKIAILSLHLSVVSIPEQDIKSVVYYSHGAIELERMILVTTSEGEVAMLKKALDNLKGEYLKFVATFLKKLDENPTYREEYLRLVASDNPDAKSNLWLPKIISEMSKLTNKERSLFAYQPLLIQLKFIRDTTMVFSQGSFRSLLGKQVESLISEMENDLMARVEHLKLLDREQERSLKPILDQFVRAKECSSDALRVSLLTEFVTNKAQLILTNKFFEHQIAKMIRVMVQAAEILKDLDNDELKVRVRSARDCGGRLGFNVSSILELVETLRFDEQPHARRVLGEFASF